MKVTLPPAHPSRYFAVLDTDGRSASLWHLDRRGNLVAWPRGARNGPMLWKTPGPGREHVVPSDLVDGARSAWIEHWADTVSTPWRERIRTAIETDPDRHAAMFAFTEANCCKCGRPLEDPESRASAVGPKCGPLLPPHIREALRREVARLVALRAQEDDDTTVLTGDRILEVVAR